MYTDSTLQPINDNAPYVDAAGTQYPGDYPKDEISSLHSVTLTAAPSDPSLVVTGFIIDESYTQVWQTQSKTPEQIAAELKARASGLYAQAFALGFSPIIEKVVLGQITFTDATVVTWVQYLQSLRQIMSAGTGSIPETPSYPVNS